MFKRNLTFILMITAVLLISTGIPIQSQVSGYYQGVIAGRNVNMVAGTQLPDGDPWLQRQNEPSIAVSTRNPLHLLAGANDYRTIDMPGLPTDELPGQEEELTAQAPREPWLGVFKSYDGGRTWISTLLPGFPQDDSDEGLNSPLKLDGWTAAADPVVRAGANGMFYYCGIAFDRLTKEGVVFVARFIDNNNKEKGDAIKYLDTKIIATGLGDIFIDKPWIAVDSPRFPSQKVTIDGQTISRHNVYLTYSAFTGEGENLEAQIMFTRSTDCGETWSQPFQLSRDTQINQGSTIAVLPNSGTVVVAWRVFGQIGQSDQAIYAAKSPSRGQSFHEPIKVASFYSFDQPSSVATFRTNSYPTMAVDDKERIYIAWSQRHWGPNEAARVVISSSKFGYLWTEPQPVDASGEGHQVMPALSFAGGKLMVIWYDQRQDISQNFDKWIQDIPNQPRHTLDVRVAQADPERFPVFEPSVQVSRYVFVLTDQGPQQAQFNPVNFPLFKAGTWPFMGDYIDIAPSPMFVRHRSGHWVFNTMSSNSILFHAAWTDNRDVRPPVDGNWTTYIPPYSFQEDPNFDTGQVCYDWTKAGMRNQNIYTSRITQGIIVGSPQNTKPLGTLGYTPDGLRIPRAFVVFVHNTTGEIKNFRLTIMNQPPHGSASFLEFEPLYELDVTVAPYSSISRPVFVDSTDPKATVSITVSEIYEPYGELIPGGLEGSVTLNPDPTNPDIENPDIDNPDIENPDIDNFEVHNPDIENPDIINWNYDKLNPDIINPDIDNPDIINPDIINPDIDNPDILNPDIDNPDILNPDILNPDIDNPSFGDLTDVIWRITNVGNTTSSYQFRTISSAAEADGTLPGGIVAQLLIYKVYSTPAEFGSSEDPCSLREKEHHELILNIINPDIDNPDIDNPDIDNPDIDNPDIDNATFALAPEEQALVILRLWEPTSSTSGLLRGTMTLESGKSFDPGTDLVGVTWSHEGNTEDRQEGDETNPGDATDLIVSTTDGTLAEGTAGEEYGDFLRAFGGEEPYTWAVIGGSLPSGLALVASTGEIWGEPDIAGTTGFTVQVTDNLGDTATQDLHILVRPPGGGDVLTITSDSVLADGAVGTPYSETITVQNGTPPYTWESDPLPAGLSFSNGVISGTPTEAGGPFGFNIVVRDSSATQQVANQDFYITILGELTITTTSVADGVLGNVYSDTLSAEGGKETYTWEFVSGALPSGLDLTSDGVISGTAITESGDYPKSYTFTVQVRDDGPPLQTALKQLTMHIAQPLDIATNALVDGIGGLPYAGGALAATGGILPYSWSSDPLPGGLYLNEETGQIYGTPEQPWGPGFITIRVTDSSSPPQSAGKQFELTIRPNTTLPGIVSWWPADGDASDIVGGNHGTLENGTQFAAGMTDLAFYFDGTDDWVHAPSTNIGDLQTLTLETWVKANSWPANSAARFVTITGEKAVLRYDGYSSQDGHEYLHFYMKINGQLQHIFVDDVIGSGCFNHVAGTYDGSSMRLYLNGVEIGSYAISGTVDPGTAVELGSDWEPLDGLLDEVKIYNRALTPQEIQASYLAGGPEKCVWPLEITTASLPDGEADQAYSAALEVTGGIPPYTWAVVSGDLPAGLSLSSEGVLSGTPTAGGTYSFVAGVTDLSLQTLQQQYSITIIADYIITGTLRYNGEPLTGYDPGIIDWWGIGSFPPQFNSATGQYSMQPVTPGKYHIVVYIDAEAAPSKWFPGDFNGGTGDFTVAEGDYSVTKDIDLWSLIHLTSPFDNNNSYGNIPGEDPPQPYGPFRTHTSTVLFRADRVPGAETYSLSVYKYFTDGNPTELIEYVQINDDGTNPEHTFILPLSGTNDYYHFFMNARAGGKNIGVVMMKYDNGYGGGYQFKVVPPSHSVTTPTAPSGPNSGVSNTSYTFSTGGSDCSNGDSVEYQFDWGDGTQSGWSSSTSASHSWPGPGTYSVMARARCSVESDAVSDWSPGITVTINPDLAAYYPFNGNANDETGNGNNGTVNGATLAADRFGNPNSAYAFNGIADSIEIQDSASFNFNSPLTLSAWVYLNDNSKGGIIGHWGHGGEAGDAFILYVQNEKLSTYLPQEGQEHYELQSDSALAPGQWYLVSMVSTGDLVDLYVNGILDKSEAVTVEQVDSSQTVEIGVDDRGVDLNYLDGIIDDVRIYKRALSASEILALYTNQVDQEFVSDVGNLADNVGLNCMYAAQTFTAGVTGTLTGVNIALYRAGDTPYPLRVAIHSVDNETPTWVELASTLVMPENQKDSWQEALEYLVTFQPGAQVQAGYQYAIVVNYVGASTEWPPEGLWIGRTTDPLYSGGSMFSAECTGDTGPVWHLGPYDLFFRTYVSITI